MKQRAAEVMHLSEVKIRDVALGVSVHAKLFPYAKYTEHRIGGSGLIGAIDIHPDPSKFADKPSISVVDMGDNNFGIEWDLIHYPTLPEAQHPRDSLIIHIAQAARMRILLAGSM